MLLNGLNPDALKGALTQDLLEQAAKAAFANPANSIGPNPLMKAGIASTLGLTGVLLEAPAKSLFPVYSPLLNEITRHPAAVGADAAQWKSVDAINTANLGLGVAEGERNAFVTTAVTPHLASFASLGLDDFVTFEAIRKAIGFDDVRSRAAINLLFAAKIGEEQVVLGGNAVALGVPATAAVSAAQAGGSLADDTYKVQVTALVLRGYKIQSGALAAGGPYTGIIGNDGVTDAIGETGPSVASAGVATSGSNNSFTTTWAAMKGAVAYNVYVQKGSGSYYFQTQVTVGSAKISAFANTPAPNTHVPNTADQTASLLEFEGMIAQIEKATLGSFYDQKAAALTADTQGGIVEFNTILLDMWNKYKLGPNMILMNASDFQNVTLLVTATISTGVQHTIFLQDGQKNVIGGLAATSYLNKFASSFAKGIPSQIPMMIHPDLPQGTILFIIEKLPYPINQIPNVWELEVLQEYTYYDWPTTKRRYEFGIYWMEVLKGYFPKANAALVSVKNATS